jgi:hypothetical protein
MPAPIKWTPEMLEALKTLRTEVRFKDEREANQC